MCIRDSPCIAGAGAYVAGDAVLIGGLFQANQSTYSGGGLYVAVNLTLTGTRFISNTAQGASNYGGGAFVNGIATLNGGLFQGNQIERYGGGLRTGTLVLSGTQFISNTATGDYGGGAYIISAATLNGGLFQGNRARVGGGVYATGSLAMTGTQFISNTAQTDGGGVYVTSGSNRRLVNVLLARNGAGGSGAAIYFAANATGSTELVHSRHRQVVHRFDAIRLNANDAVPVNIACSKTLEVV